MTPMPALTYRYRLYPTSVQEEKMYGWLQALRWLYNAALAQRRAAWRCERRSINVNSSALRYRNSKNESLVWP
jgi:transposase